MSEENELEWLATRGNVTRRAFMGRAAALGASTALILSALGKATFADEAPQKGGHLVLGLDGASASDSLDPATYIGPYKDTVGFQWGNCLVELDEKNEAIPELAESWEPKADATQWVFKLRKGVAFHNGKEMTAADVVYSINHHRGEQSKSGALAFVKPITDLKATDSHEVTVTLASPNVDLPYILADFHLLIMPEGSAADAGIGTGGYVIEAFEPGVRTLARRNENYWKEGRAHAETVETLGINDMTARTSAVQTGAAHFISRLDPKTISLFERNENIAIIDVPSSGYNNFPMRCDTAPYSNKDLRLALKYAIDRQDMVDRILQGYGRVGNDHTVPDFDRFYAADIPQRPYDPDKAKHHFAKSGIEGPLILQVADVAFPNAVDAAVLYKESAAKAGIPMEIKREPDDGYWSEVWMVQPFTAGYGTGRPTADMVLSLLYMSSAPWNETYWKRDDFDQLLIAARGELDTSKRKQMYHDLQMMIWEDGGSVVPLFNNSLFASASNLKGMVRAPVFSGYRVAEQAYFA